MGGVRSGAAEARAVSRALAGMARRLPWRQTGRVKLRGSLRTPGRSGAAGQYRDPHEPEARMGRCEHEVSQLPRGGQVCEPTLPGWVRTIMGRRAGRQKRSVKLQAGWACGAGRVATSRRSEEHTSELQALR